MTVEISDHDKYVAVMIPPEVVAAWKDYVEYAEGVQREYGQGKVESKDIPLGKRAMVSRKINMVRRRLAQAWLAGIYPDVSEGLRVLALLERAGYWKGNNHA